jgi:hypothetical protein
MASRTPRSRSESPQPGKTWTTSASVRVPSPFAYSSKAARLASAARSGRPAWLARVHRGLSCVLIRRVHQGGSWPGEHGPVRCPCSARAEGGKPHPPPRTDSLPGVICRTTLPTTRLAATCGPWAISSTPTAPTPSSLPSPALLPNRTPGHRLHHTFPALRALAQLADAALHGGLDGGQDSCHRGAGVLVLLHRGEEGGRRGLWWRRGRRGRAMWAFFLEPVVSRVQVGAGLAAQARRTLRLRRLPLTKRQPARLPPVRPSVARVSRASLPRGSVITSWSSTVVRTSQS